MGSQFDIFLGLTLLSLRLISAEFRHSQNVDSLQDRTLLVSCIVLDRRRQRVK